RNPPPGLGVGASASIRFLRDASGEYRLSDRIPLSGLETPLSIGLQTQAMQLNSLPGARDLLDSIVASPRGLDAKEFLVRPGFFASGHGDTFAQIDVALRGSLLARSRDRGPAPSEGPAGLASVPPTPQEGLESSPGTVPQPPAAPFEIQARLVGQDPELPRY